MHTLARLTAPLSRPLAGRRWFPLWAVLRHRGRVSGRAYAIPIAIRRTPDGFVIPVPFGPGTQWVRNVEAAGGASIRWRGREYAVTAPTLVDRAAGAVAFTPAMLTIMARTGIDQVLLVRDA